MSISQFLEEKINQVIMISYIPNLIFIIIFSFAIFFFTRNILKLRRVILMGQGIERSDRKSERMKNMIKIALGQSKMVAKPISGILHVVVYIGFIIINIELLEIVIDGMIGSHRFFSKYISSSLYNFLIGFFEFFALLVLIAVVIFWIRRNILKIKRFLSNEMKGWPKFDADNILYFEIVLMLLFLSMNATDLILQNREYYSQAGFFPISSFLVPIFDSFST